MSDAVTPRSSSRGNAEEKRRKEMERAWQYSDSGAWCWIIFFAFFAFFFLWVLAPNYNGNAYLAHRRHHRDDDDDDTSSHHSGNGTEHSHSDDDDDDDDDNHYGHEHYGYYPPPRYGYYPFFAYEKLDASADDSEVTRARVKATATLPHIDSDTSTVWKGDNRGYEGCISDAERTQLDASVARPSAHILLNEKSGEIEFIVHAPYIAADGAYVATFEPMPKEIDVEIARGTDFLHTPGTCQSAGKMDYEDAWLHAPNALYTEAFNKSSLYRGTEWQFYPLSCSEFAMHWSATAPQLERCRTSDKHSSPIAFSATDTAVSVSGTLWVHYIRPDMSSESWPFAFEIHIDQYESKIAVTDVPAQHYVRTSEPRVNEDQLDVSAAQKMLQMHAQSTLHWVTHTGVEKVWFDAEGDGEDAKDTELHKERAMRMHLMSRSASPYALFAEATRELHADQSELLAAVRAAAPSYRIAGFETFFRSEDKQDLTGRFRVTEADFVDELKRSAAPRCEIAAEADDIVVCTQNYTIVLVPLQASSAELYEGAFELKMNDVKQPAHSVRFDVAVTDPSTDVVDVEQMQTEITSHLNNAATKKIHENAFVGGDRVCMQTYAMGPAQLMQAIDVRTIAAWLCVDDSKDVIRDLENKARTPHNPERVKSRQLRQSSETKLSRRSRYLSTQAAHGTGCSERRHSIQLFGRASPNSSLSTRELRKSRDIVVQTYAPTLHEPGAYGTWSSALCFNISTLFVDQAGNSVHRQRYYFQSEVVVMPTEKRRDSTLNMHRTFAAFERVAAAAADTKILNEHSAKAARLLRGLPVDLTSTQLGELLEKLNKNKKLDRYHTATFDVTVGSTRQENHLYGVRQATSITVFFFILIFAICIVAATWGFLNAYYGRRRAAAAGSAAEARYSASSKKMML